MKFSGKHAAAKASRKSAAKPASVKTAVKKTTAASSKQGKTSSRSSAVSTKDKKERMTPSSPAPSAEQKRQSEAFNKGMEYFHAREFKKAMQAFEQAMEGPVRDLAFAARNHHKMCEQRLERSQMQISDPEDRYAYAITRINVGDYTAAEAQLTAALKQKDADHYHYALALCLGSKGDLDGAVRHLGRAIQLNPRNRSSVKNDPDFAELLRQAPLRDLLAGA
jgi:tetratricopeptide (TPR) repeat protein